MSIPTHYSYGFDPTCGLTLEELLAVQPPPAPLNFDHFWQARYNAALGVTPRPRLGESVSGHPDWIVQDISYISTDAFEIGGWLMLPTDGKVTRGLVVGHGYGGRDQPDFNIQVKETAVLFPCCRGLSRSRRPPISTDPALHVLHDIDQPEHYILGGCVEDIWLAVSVLTELYPEIDGRIGYSGISFGGGVGALAIAFDKRIDRGHLALPTFSNMPLWLTLPTIGSAASVQIYQKTHPDVINTLRLFDAASAATRIRIPMLMAVARFDPAVAPPCQFSVANGLPTSTHHETVILDAGHFDYPDRENQNALHLDKFRRFFQAT